MSGMIGKYEIERELGRGAMGVVYLAVDPQIARRVAIKTIRLDLLDSAERAEVLERFRREAQAAGRLNHPNIVSVYEYGEADGQAYIVMELIDGQELKAMLEARQRFDAAGVGKLMGQLLDALDFSHRNGVVHRDIKPANVFVLPDGRIKVTDFGIARVASSTLTQTGSVLGTPSYMSPEQFMGLPVDGRSDLFSAGVVLYELLTGEKPFSGSAVTTIMHKVLNEVPPSPSALNFQLPRGLDMVVAKALAKRPEDRFQSGAEFAQALTAALAQASAPAAGDATMVRPAAVDATVVRGPMPGPAAAAPLAAAEAPKPISTPLPAQAAPAAKKTPVALIAGGAIAVILVAGIAVFALRGGEPKPGPAATAEAPVAGAPAAVPAAAPKSNLLVMQTEAILDPNDERAKGDPNLIKVALQEESKRQFVEKALAFMVSDDSINRNYGVLRDKLISRGDEFVQEQAAQEAPWLGKDGLLHMRTQGVVRMREVQKSLNQMSRDERIDLIRKGGDPKIAVSISAADAERSAGVAPQRSAVAENTLKEKITAFGYRTWSEAPDKKGADFLIVGEAKFKKLSHKLEASGLVITKHVLTSWTVKCIDAKTGEEVYYNTQIPEGQSWADEDQAIRAIGGLIGDQFSKSFFAQFIQPEAVKMSLSFEGVSDGKLQQALQRELSGLRQVSSVAPEGKGFTLMLAPSEGPAASNLAGVVVEALNRKLGQTCFQPGASEGSRVVLRLVAPCTEALALERMETRLPAGLYMAPEQRHDAVLKNRELRGKIRA